MGTIVRPTNEELDKLDVDIHAFHYRQYEERPQYGTTKSGEPILGHPRFVEREGKASYYEAAGLKLNPTGGRTLVVLTTRKDGHVFIGESWCVWEDHFVRRIGFALALKEAINSAWLRTGDKKFAEILEKFK